MTVEWEWIEIEPPLELKRMGRPSLLSPEVTRDICAAIRAGAFPWVAAAMHHVHPTTFKGWMKDPRPAYTEFQEAVRQATAQARVVAEIEVKKSDPKFWLTKGPGRERPDEPGWSDGRTELVGPNGGPVQIQAVPRIDLSALSDEEFQALEAINAKLLSAGSAGGPVQPESGATSDDIVEGTASEVPA